MTLLLQTVVKSATEPIQVVIKNIPEDSGFWDLSIGDILTGVLMPASLYYLPIFHAGRKDYFKLHNLRNNFLNSLLDLYKTVNFEISLMDDYIAFLESYKTVKPGQYSKEFLVSTILQVDVDALENAMVHEVLIDSNIKQEIYKNTRELKGDYITIRKIVTEIDSTLTGYVNYMNEMNSVALKLDEAFNINKHKLIGIIASFAGGEEPSNKAISEVADDIVTNDGFGSKHNVFMFYHETIEKFYAIVDKELGKASYPNHANLREFVKRAEEIKSAIWKFDYLAQQTTVYLKNTRTLIVPQNRFIHTYLYKQMRFGLKRKWWLGLFGKDKPMVSPTITDYISFDTKGEPMY